MIENLTHVLKRGTRETKKKDGRCLTAKVK